MPRLCVAFALAAVARAQTSLVDDDDAYDPARKIPAGIDDPDYLYSDWYLGPRGINATGAWAAFGVTGAGVQIVFNDDGLDTEHAEFAAKFDAAGSCNDPTPVNVTTETHGTICAGLAVAAANSDCSVGVAPGATVAACDIYNKGDVEGMLAYRLDLNDISSNSWGVDSCSMKQDNFTGTVTSESVITSCPFLSPDAEPLSPCAAAECASADWNAPSDACSGVVIDYCLDSMLAQADDACIDYYDYFVECSFNSLSNAVIKLLTDATASGRGGLGTIYTFAAGNEHNLGKDVNFEGYTNSRFTITVAATGSDGRHSSYSDTGAAVHVCAPGGDGDQSNNMFSTLPDGTCKPGDEYEVGTSYATPLVSGTIALMLEQNPALTWLDVQNILARTSDKIDAGDESWATNGAGLSHSYLYGFGQVNAYKAVGMARNFSEAGAGLPQVSLSHARKPGLIIADGASASDTISVGDGSALPHGVQHATVYITIETENLGNLEVSLTSPSGVVSVLATAPRPTESWEAYAYGYGGASGFGYGYDNWKFTTLRAWGENATGDWTLNVVDTLDGGGESQLVKWSVVLFGQGPKGGGGGGGGGLAWWVWGLVGVGSFAVLAATGAVCYFKARPRKDAGGADTYGQSNPVADKSAIA